MLKKLFIVFFIIFLCGCNNKEKEYKYATDDNRLIFFIYDVEYIKNNTSSSVRVEIQNNRMTINEFINDLEYVSSLWDGGSKIYKYDPKNKKYGDNEFYVLSCNTLDGIKDVYVAQNKETLNNKCNKERKIVEKELQELQEKIINITDEKNYKNWAAMYVENNKIIIELVENSKEEQKWFRENIIDSEYIVFKKGGPYFTSSDYEEFYDDELLKNITKLKDLPHNYSIEEAKKNNDVIIYNNESNIIINYEVLENFLEKINKKEKAFMRLININVEGGMIITDVKVDKDNITIIEDNTRDHFTINRRTIKKFKNIKEVIEISDISNSKLIVYNENEEDGVILYNIQRFID